MTNLLLQGYYCFVVVLAAWTVLLAAVSVFQRLRSQVLSRRAAAISGLFAVGVALLPVGEFAIWRWCFSAHANPSVPLAALLALFVLGRLTHRPWLNRTETATAWVFGAVAGAVLYAPIFGLQFYDGYAWDWEGPWVAASIGALAAGLLLAGNRFGLVLAASLLAHLLGLMESDNLWDYVIDPLYWLVAFIGAVQWAASRTIARREGALANRSPAS